MIWYTIDVVARDVIHKYCKNNKYLFDISMDII